MGLLLGLAVALGGLPLETWDTAGEAAFRKEAPVLREHVDGFIWVDAEDFQDYGGWKVDTQFVHLMGSAYLIAPGVGEPVSDAATSIQVREADPYHVWVRCRDWLPAHHPGRFRVLVNDVALPTVLGHAEHDAWGWVRAGEAPLEAGENTLALRDLSGSFARCDALLLTRDPDYTPPNELAHIEVERARLTGLSLAAQHRGDFDVVVVGGGPSGCPAAIAAARLGAKTALIQDRPVLGGNASLELGVGMEGASISQRNARETGIVEEAARMRAHHGWRRDTIAFHRLAEAEETLTLFLNTRVIDATLAGPGKIAGVKGVDTLTGAYSTYGAKLVVDCTGDGWVGYYAGAEYRLGREPRSKYGEPDAPEEADEITMSGCIMGRHGVGYRAEKTDTPIRFTAPAWAAALPGLVEAGRHPRTITSGEWWMEHAGTWDDLEDAERARDELIRISFGYWDYLKNRWPEKARVRNHKLVYVPWLVAKRETRRLIGDHVLTTDDVLSGTIFPDRISYGGWPVDIHNPDGIYKGTTPYHTNYHIDEMYTVPYRCLYSKNIENLLFAGRCASVSHFGLGTIRVERTLATLGQAAGTAAALCIEKDVTPRSLYEDHIRELQQTLLRNDQYIPEVANEDPDDLARQARVMASSTARGVQLDSDEIQLSSKYHPMNHKRGMMLPVAHGRIDRARLYLTSEREDTVTLRLHLREAAHHDDFSSTADVAVAEAALPPGTQGWRVFEINQAVSTPHAWLWLEPVKGVQWRLIQSGIPGMKRAYAAPSADGDAAWTRPGGYYACLLAPPITAAADCSPKNVISGVSRMTDSHTHMWRSAPDAALPQWLEFEFPKKTTFDTVQLTFVTDLNTRHLAPTGMLSGVTAYRLQIPQNGGWKTIFQETGNYQRWRRHRFAPVTCSRLRVVIDEVAGMSSAAVYEVRVYNRRATENTELRE